MRCRDLLFALALAAACGGSEVPEAEAQWVIVLDTDAPLPSVRGTTIPPLFDRLRVEMFPPGAQEPCAGCVREFAAERETFEEGRSSFGIVPSSRAPGTRVRVRLYRAVWLEAGEPRPSTAIETVVALPDPPESGSLRVVVRLRVEDLARPRGTLDAPIAADPGDAPKLGPWRGAERVPCAGAPAADEACVPGGAYWMGDPAIGTLDPGSFDGDLPRIVSLSPFFVDRREMSVGEWRASHAVGAADLDPRTTSAIDQECTLTVGPGANEDKPLVCITAETARAHCESRGKKLLSEAQFEYLASGLAGSPYVWGKDPPSCGDAVYARDADGTDRTKECVDTMRRGLANGGSGRRDRLALAGGDVVDLAGNATEWVADEHRAQDDVACWGAGIFRDPLCTATSGRQAMRGGSAVLLDLNLRAQLRASEPKPTKPLTSVGFRCARPSR